MICWSTELILELIMLIQLQLVRPGNLPSANITGAPALQVVKLILHNAGLGKSPFQALNKHLFLVKKLGRMMTVAWLVGWSVGWCGWVGGWNDLRGPYPYLVVT